MRKIIAKLFDRVTGAIYGWLVSKDTTGLDFSKMRGYIIVVVQDATTKAVLMVGVMNEEAVQITQKSGKVTLWSRTKGRLWTKGETSGNSLLVRQILVDCDADTLLIMVDPIGPTCHTGAVSCFEELDGTVRLFTASTEKE
jgi:phosphoribosyl-ATP pyrophosphohydrolase/phosphoribosyl-AMP cyclohydrolase